MTVFIGKSMAARSEGRSGGGEGAEENESPQLVRCGQGVLAEGERAEASREAASNDLVARGNASRVLMEKRNEVAALESRRKRGRRGDTLLGKRKRPLTLTRQ